MEIPLTPLEFARRARRLYPQREAVVDAGRRFTYSEFFQRCDQWSSAMQQLGIAPQDRVAYIAPNTHAHLEAYYAVPQIGAVLVPINYRLTAEECAYIIAHSGASMLCVHSDYLDAIDRVRALLPGVKHFVALEGDKAGWLNYETLLRQSSGAFAPPPLAESDLLTINYTSGTTSRPKGVMITHRNAYLNVAGVLIHQHLTPADRYLWTLPMFHANGWTFVWIVTAVGATHVCLRKVDQALVYDQLNQESITLLCAAPTVLIALAEAPEASRRAVRRGVRIITAGAPPAAATIERIEGELGWHITQMYGMTETSPFISLCEPRPEHDPLSLSDRAIIKARQGVELVTSGELLVLSDQGSEVPHDGQTLGEIVVRGNVVMKGYYNDPEATDQAMRDGWMHTGDAAVVHPDGYIEIRDRIKDIIISGGENISSVEVEGVLLRHPAVQEAAIVGLPHPKWGEAAHAFVVLRAGASTTEADLREFARANLAHFKAPQGVTFVTELPKTATGKIQKFALRGNRPNIARQ